LWKLGDGQILHRRERRTSSTRPPTPLCCIYDGSSGRCVAVVRVKREAEDLVWDYQDVAVICGGPMAPAQTCPMSVWLTSAT
jgi:hypothetical protein